MLGTQAGSVDHLSSELPLELKACREEKGLLNSEMRLGGLVGLYAQGLLRFDRAALRGHSWAAFRVARLVEAILLGWPLPSALLVREQDESLTVIGNAGFLEELVLFMNQGLESEGTSHPLVGCKYLPHLEGRIWAGEGHTLSLAEKSAIRQTSVNINIVSRQQGETDEDLLFFWR